MPSSSSSAVATGLLALSSGSLTANTTLDSHFLNQLHNVHSLQGYGLGTSLEARAVYVGYEATGNVLGAVVSDGVLQIMLRDDSTGGDLVYYHTTGSGSAVMRDVNNESARYRFD